MLFFLAQSFFEREGVLSQQVVALDGKSPVIEVPVVGSYGPNVFVSAFAVRGRVDTILRVR
jgi:uncharacterized protein YfaS (alpha-2-macroglobulin family)